MRPTHTLLYDADCGFCRWSLGWLLRWDRRGALRPVALQDERAAELLAPMPEATRMASWHLVAPDGEVRSAGAGAAPLLRLLPGGRIPAAAFERLPGAVDRAYRWVSGRRAWIGPKLPRQAVARADALIADRGALPSSGPQPSEIEEATT